MMLPWVGSDPCFKKNKWVIGVLLLAYHVPDDVIVEVELASHPHVDLPHHLDGGFFIGCVVFHKFFKTF